MIISDFNIYGEPRKESRVEQIETLKNKKEFIGALIETDSFRAQHLTDNQGICIGIGCCQGEGAEER